jgi:spore germination cell wall hydrolase CwlJ-like protein
VPDPPPNLAGAGDLLCLAVAIYHEARDQPLDGQLAVASVILNRTKEPDRWGSTPCAVVVPGQFSFLSEDGSYPAISKDEAWAIAVEMASEALERGPSPLVGQADHYHIRAVSPAWNQDMQQVIRIDDHIFFLDPATRG